MKNRNIFIALFLVDLLLLFIGLKILFPTFCYDLIAVKTALHQPEIKVAKTQTAEADYLSVAPFLDYNFNSLQVKLDQKLKVPELKVYKGEYFSFYPQGELIDSREKLEAILGEDENSFSFSGQLIKNKEAVFLLSKGKKRAFVDPLVFNKLGFDWGSVREDQEGQLNQLEKGVEINFNSPHPSDVVIEFEGQNYLIYEKRLYPLSQKIKDDFLAEVIPIKVAQLKPQLLGECQRQFSLLGNFKCQLKLDQNPTEIAASTYFVELLAGTTEEVKEAEVTLSAWGKFQLATARKTLANLKNILVLRYGDFLFN